jgi:hypothetical protein
MNTSKLLSAHEKAVRESEQKIVDLSAQLEKIRSPVKDDDEYKVSIERLTVQVDEKENLINRLRGEIEVCCYLMLISLLSTRRVTTLPLARSINCLLIISWYVVQVHKLEMTDKVQLSEAKSTSLQSELNDLAARYEGISS